VRPAALLGATLGLLLAVVALTVIPGPAAGAHPSKRADLRVRAGRLTTTGGVLTVTGRILNSRSKHGRAARRTAAAVIARAGSTSRVLARIPVAALRNGGHRTVRATARTTGLSEGRWTITLCADAGKVVRERREGNNCRMLGALIVPAAKLRLPTDTEASYTDAGGRYWVYVPSDLGAAPAGVLIWLHGCGGDHGDLWGAADYTGQHYIAVLPDGAEGGCWNMATGPDRVVAAVRSVIAHFTVDPKRIVIGGYSSGGDLAYRTAFLHADLFAGVLAMNTSPFRNNGTSASVAAHAARRLPIYHLAHDGDDTYPLAGVQDEIGQLVDLGFPVTFEHVPGGHWSEPSAPGAPDGTWWDFQHRVVEAHMGSGWRAP